MDADQIKTTIYDTIRTYNATNGTAYNAITYHFSDGSMQMSVLGTKRLMIQVGLSRNPVDEWDCNTAKIVNQDEANTAPTLATAILATVNV